MKVERYAKAIDKVRRKQKYQEIHVSGFGKSWEMMPGFRFLDAELEATAGCQGEGVGTGTSEHHQNEPSGHDEQDSGAGEAS